jgi:hypothetical protein
VRELNTDFGNEDIGASHDTGIGDD